MSDKCPFEDPHCPCQDGDACHYVDYPGSPAMKPPIDWALNRIAELEVENNRLLIDVATLQRALRDRP